MYKLLLIASIALCIGVVATSCKKSKDVGPFGDEPAPRPVPIGFEEVSDLVTLRTAACIKVYIKYPPRENDFYYYGLPEDYVGGIVYSTSSDLSIDTDTVKSSTFVQTEYQLFDLTPNTQYYYKAYYKKKADNKFHGSEIKTFATKDYTAVGTDLRINLYTDERPYYNGVLLYVQLDDFPYPDLMTQPSEVVSAAYSLLNKMGILYVNGTAKDLKGADDFSYHTDCNAAAGIQEYKIFIDGLYSTSNTIQNLGTYTQSTTPSLNYTTLPRGSKVLLNNVNPSDFSATYFEKPIIKIGGKEFPVEYETINNLTKYYFTLTSDFPVGTYSLTYKVLCSEVALAGTLTVVKQ